MKNIKRQMICLLLIVACVAWVAPPCEAGLLSNILSGLGRLFKVRNYVGKGLDAGRQLNGYTEHQLNTPAMEQGARDASQDYCSPPDEGYIRPAPPDREPAKSYYDAGYGAERVRLEDEGCDSDRDSNRRSSRRSDRRDRDDRSSRNSNSRTNYREQQNDRELTPAEQWYQEKHQEISERNGETDNRQPEVTITIGPPVRAARTPFGTGGAWALSEGVEQPSWRH